MQVISKIEPTSPSSTASNINPKSLKEMMETITKRLQSGQESANQLRNLYNKRLGFKVEDNNNNNDDQSLFDHHSWVTLSSFEECISMLKSYDFDHHHQKQQQQHKRKVDQSVDYHVDNSEDISDVKVFKERRGCYKRRKAGNSRIIEATTLIDDGYAWRKYGQKEILHTKYPRNYYRCTHKHEQNCQATKQVQQKSDDPIKYNIVYNGHHTCKNYNKTSSLIIDDPQDENSSFFLNFGSNNYPTPKHALNNNNPPMFPSTTFHNTSNSTTIVKEESPMVAPHDHGDGHGHGHGQSDDGAHKRYPSTSSSSGDNNHPSSTSSLTCDVTSTGLSSLSLSSSSTPVSEQSDVMSQQQFATPPYEIMDEDLFLSLMDMKQDYNNLHLDGLF